MSALDGDTMAVVVSETTWFLLAVCLCFTPWNRLAALPVESVYVIINLSPSPQTF